MTTYTLGKVGLNPRSVYNADAAYEKLDIVSHNGSSYVALDSCTGVDPTDASKWMLLTQGTAAPAFEQNDATKNVPASSFTSMLTYTAVHAGCYLLDMTLLYAGHSGGRRCLVVEVNGVRDNSACVFTVPSESAQTALRSNALLYLNAGDVVNLIAYQTSGSALNTEAHLKKICLG